MITNNNEIQVVLAIDLGGTNCAFGLVNQNAEIIWKNDIKTNLFSTPEALIDAISNQVTAFLGKQSLKLLGIGIGAPNASAKTRTIAYAPNLPWGDDIPFAAMVQEKFGCEVAITNDANAAAIGEKCFGAAKNLSDFVSITLGTGLGSGIFVNNQAVEGHDGFGGEIGHMILVPNGRKCNCGRHGCVETYVSATAIRRTYGEEAKIKWELAPSSATIAHMAANGDPIALKCFELTSYYLGLTLANVASVLSPHTFFLSGGLAQAGDLLLNGTRAHFEDNLLQVYKGKISIKQSGLGGNIAALLGAAALIWLPKS